MHLGVRDARPWPRPKITSVSSDQLSRYQESASLILTCFLIAVAAMAMTAQRGLLARVYGKTYTDLAAGTAKAERQRLAFVYHHVAAVLFTAVAAAGAYPAVAYIVEPGTTLARTILPHGPEDRTTVGDMLFILAQFYSAYYLFEIVFRARFLSYISLAHHIGLLLVVQFALDFIGRDPDHPNSAKEFYFCMVWGMFDVVTELPLHIVLILWRVKRTNKTVCYWIPRGCFVWVCAAAVTETVVTIYLLQQSWLQWHLEWRIITPTVFTLWITTQFYGAFIFLKLARAEGEKAKNANPDTSAV